MRKLSQVQHTKRKFDVALDDENDVEWSEPSIPHPVGDMPASQSVDDTPKVSGYFSGRLSTKRIKRKPRTPKKEAGLSDLQTLMSNILNGLDTTGKPQDTVIHAALTDIQSAKKVDVTPLLTKVVGPESLKCLQNKDIADFTAEDFALIEEAVLAKLSQTPTLESTIRSSSSSSSSRCSNSSINAQRDPLAKLDLNSTSTASVKPKKAITTIIQSSKTVTLPTTRKPTDASTRHLNCTNPAHSKQQQQQLEIEKRQMPPIQQHYFQPKNTSNQPCKPQQPPRSTFTHQYISQQQHIEGTQTAGISQVSRPNQNQRTTLCTSQDTQNTYRNINDKSYLNSTAQMDTQIPQIMKSEVQNMKTCSSKPIQQQYPPQVQSSGSNINDISVEDVSLQELAMLNALEAQALARLSTQSTVSTTISSSVTAVQNLASIVTSTPSISIPPAPGNNTHSSISTSRNTIPPSISNCIPVSPLIFCNLLRVMHIELHRYINKTAQRLYCRLSDSEYGSIAVVVDLLDDWADMLIRVGDDISVVELGPSDLNSGRLGLASETTNQHPDSIAIRTYLSTLPTWNQLVKASVRWLILDSHSGLLIVQPQTLVSPTRVAEACQCPRRCVVAERAKPVRGNSSAPAILGNLRHEFIENLLALYLDERHAMATKMPPYRDCSQQYSQPCGPPQSSMDPRVQKIANESIKKHAVDLHSIGADDIAVNAELVRLFPQVVSWAEEAYSRGLSSKLIQIPSTSDSNSNFRRSNQPALEPRYSLCTQQAAEEVIWSPILGLKGKMDLLMHAQLHVFSPSIATGATDDHSLKHSVMKVTFPVELKTGQRKASQANSHRAQVILYLIMLLMRERGFRVTATSRHDSTGEINSSTIANETLSESKVSQREFVEVRELWPRLMSEPSVEGLLLYLSEGESFSEVISPDWSEIRALILARNTLARFLTRTSTELSTKASIDNFQPILPPLLGNSRECSFCYQASECMMYHAALEGGHAATSQVPELFRYILRDVSPLHVSYIRHWEKLLDMEETATARHNSPWESSKGLTGLKLEDCVSSSTATIGNKYVIALRQSNPSVEFMNLTDGTRVLVSIEKSVSSTTFQAESVIITQPKLPTGCHKNTSETLSTADVEDLCGGLTQVYVAKTSMPSAEMQFSVTGQVIAHPQTGSLSNFIGQKAQKVYIATEPRVIVGTVTKREDDVITVEISESPKRFVELMKRDYCTARLDVSKIAVAMSSMRAGLLAMFVDRHDPRAFNDWQRSKFVVSPGTPSGKPRLRQLIVDLLPPISKPSELLPTEAILMFTAARVDFVDFMRCVTVIDQILKESHSYSNIVASSNRSQACSHEHSEPHSIVKEAMNHAQSCDHEVQILQTYLQPDILVTVDRVGTLTIKLNYKNENASCSSSSMCCVKVYPGCNPSDLLRDFERCNTAQQDALKAALLAEDYTLLHGCPGTGKSATLALIIRALVARGQRVLLTSYTHAAVDSALVKLLSAGVTPGIVLRLGSKETVHPSVQPCLLELGTLSLIDLKNHLQGARILACTALAALRDPLVSSFSADWCVLDEAGQVLEPVAVGAIFSSRQFLLVGDPLQLPPLVVSSEAKAEQMDISLFQRLATAHPAAVSSLSSQYRMNEDVMSVCNTLFYSGKMKCDNESVARRQLSVPRISCTPIPRALKGSSQITSEALRCDWLYTCMRPDASVIFLDTDQIIPLSTMSDWTPKEPVVQTCSETEVTLVLTIVGSLHHCGVAVDNAVGVIAPYRAQVERIQGRIGTDLNCEVSTVDRFQGRDKDVVVVSTVRSKFSVGESVGVGADDAGNILRDWRRINVAFSRARTKLIVLGSMSALQSIPCLSAFVSFAAERGWIIRLPADSLQMYDVPWLNPGPM